jgi:HlyD family secretion protein
MRKLAILIMAASVLTGCGSKDGENKGTAAIAPPVNSSLVNVTEVVGVGKVEPEGEIVSLAAPTGGVVREVMKHDGENVSRGDTILALDDELEQIRVMQLRGQYQAQVAQVDIDAASLAEAEARLDNKERLLESIRSLAEKGAETAQALDDLTTEVETLQLGAEKSKASVALSQSRLQELDAQLRYAIAEADRKILRSPFGGLLLETHVMAGAAVNQYSSFAEIAPSGRTIVKAEIDELFADRLRTDLDTEIRYIGSDSTIARGTLYFLSPYLKKKSLFSGKSSEQEDRLVREVKIMIDGNPDLILNTKVECVVKL